MGPAFLRAVFPLFLPKNLAGKTNALSSQRPRGNPTTRREPTAHHPRRFFFRNSFLCLSVLIHSLDLLEFFHG